MNKKAQNIDIVHSEDIPFSTSEKDLPKYLKKLKTDEEIKIVFFGTPEFAAFILEKLIKFSENYTEKKFIIQTIITSPDKPVGRKQILTSSEVSQVADKYHIPILKPEKLTPDFVAQNASLLTCDLFIVASYGKILPQIALDIPNLGAINVHPSILPKYRGATPIQSALLNGDKETGVSIMLMDAEMDHGEILSQSKINISEQDNYLILSNKLVQLSSEILLEILPKFVKGEIKKTPQDHTKATFTKMIKKEDGFFEIDSLPAGRQALLPYLIKLDRMIRAYYPWPTAWTKWKGKVVKFLPDQMIQIEGKKAVKLKDFLNGYPDFPIKDLDI